MSSNAVKETSRAGRRLARAAGVTVTMAVTSLLLAPAARADDVNFQPTSAGLPGATGIQKFMDWIGQYSLWTLLGSLLIAAGIIGAGQLAGHQSAGRGRSAMIGAVLGTILLGFAPFLINSIFGASSGA
jgi:hypothetical protein